MSLNPHQWDHMQSKWLFFTSPPPKKNLWVREKAVSVSPKLPMSQVLKISLCWKIRFNFEEFLDQNSMTLYVLACIIHVLSTTHVTFCRIEHCVYLAVSFLSNVVNHNEMTVRNWLISRKTTLKNLRSCSIPKSHDLFVNIWGKINKRLQKFLLSKYPKWSASS